MPFPIRVFSIALPLLICDLLTLPTSEAGRNALGAYAVAAAGFLKFVAVVIMAQRPRAILFASAVATKILGLRANMRVSQEFAVALRCNVARIMAIAPTISSLRMSR